MTLTAKFKLRDRHWQVLSLVKYNRFRLVTAMICMLVESAGVSATAYMMKPVVDYSLVNNDTRVLKSIPLAIVVVYFVRALARCWGG